MRATMVDRAPGQRLADDILNSMNGPHLGGA
jgi:hypothetical protein